jgi:SAM-dependent methyltransferase
VTAVEPDQRLASFLEDRTRHTGRVTVLPGRFEDVILPDHAFDLAVAATSFHWLDARDALLSVRRALKPGGSWLACWHIFNDPEIANDPFRTATEPLLREVGRVQQDDVKGRLAFGLDRENRCAELRRAGFRRISHEVIRQKITLDAAGARDLYATFSPVSTLHPEAAAWLLTEIEKLVRIRFGGRIERPLLTPLYWAYSP